MTEDTRSSEKLGPGEKQGGNRVKPPCLHSKWADRANYPGGHAIHVSTVCPSAYLFYFVKFSVLAPLKQFIPELHGGRHKILVETSLRSL